MKGVHFAARIVKPTWGAQGGIFGPARLLARVPFVVAALGVLVQAPSLMAAQAAPASFADVSASAAAARDSGDAPRAIQLYHEAVELNPQWAPGWWNLGILQYGSNAYAPAADALTHYLSLTPNAGPAFALRGQCEFEQGQFPESLSDLQQAVALVATGTEASARQPENAVHAQPASLRRP